MDKSIQFKNAQWCQRNMHGIEIKACCASCEHKVINNDGRFCGLEKTRVASGHCCNRWQMDKRLQKAGRGGGKVKKCHYLTFFIERWIEQRSALEAGRISVGQLRTVEDIRKEYHEQYGSEFVNI